MKIKYLVFESPFVFGAPVKTITFKIRAMTKINLLTATMIFSLTFLFSPNIIKAQQISETKTAGKVSITMKVLPAEAFKGPNAEMKWDSGADPSYLDSSPKPNHHLVAFVKNDGKPVEDAKVSISYRELSPKKGEWMTLPVARMHVSGKGMETTHYGNNLLLAKGDYEARIKVNDNPEVLFRFSLAE